MNLRKLQATDLFSMVKILNGVGIKQLKSVIDINKFKDIKSKMTEENKEDVLYQVGADVIFSVVGILFENLPKIETDLYKFVGSVAGMKANEVAKMDLDKFFDLLIEIFKKDEFADFFKRASKLIK